MQKGFSVGVDIGGSHITCAAVDLGKRKIIRPTLTGKPVNNKGSAIEIIDSWAEALSLTMEKTEPGRLRGIGFAMPGPFDYQKGICLIKGVTKYENLYGINVAGAISAALDLPRGMPLRFMNDASSFAVGEAWAGRSAESSRSMAVTLGTGLGSAFIEEKVPVVRGERVPELGCVYHIPYRDGIADDYFSTRWFIRRCKEVTGKEMDGVKDMAALAASDERVKAIFDEFGLSLASFLSPFLLRFGAGVLVLGGNISRAYALFADAFEGGLKRNNCDTLPVLSELWEDAALLGSSYLLDDSFWDRVKGSLPYM